MHGPARAVNWREHLPTFRCGSLVTNLPCRPICLGWASDAGARQQHQQLLRSNRSSGGVSASGALTRPRGSARGGDLRIEAWLGAPANASRPASIASVGSVVGTAARARFRQRLRTGGRQIAQPAGGLGHPHRAARCADRRHRVAPRCSPGYAKHTRVLTGTGAGSDRLARWRGRLTRARSNGKGQVRSGPGRLRRDRAETRQRTCADQSPRSD